MRDTVDVRVDDRGRLTFGRLGLVEATLDSEGLQVRSHRHDPVVLDWDEYGELPDVMDQRPEPDRWKIGAVSINEGGMVGIAIVVGGRLRERCEPHVRHYSRGLDWLRRIDHAPVPGASGLRLPLTPQLHLDWRHRIPKLRATLSSLCEIVPSSALYRQRLDDSDRMRILAADIASQPLAHPGVESSLRRDAVDVDAALLSGGFRFRYGRPLSPSQLPSDTAVVDSVHAILNNNPHRVGRSIERSKVSELVKQRIFDVAPWPFRALVDSDPLVDAGARSTHIEPHD